MLQLLVKYGNDAGLSPEPGFAPKDVRWAICLDADGRFLGVAELGDVEDKRNKGRSFPKCPDLSQPEMIAGGVKRSHFMVETAMVLALFGLEKEKDEKKKTDAKTKHEYFRGLLRDASGVMPILAKAADCLESAGTIEKIRESFSALKAKPTDKATFKIGEAYLPEETAWHEWWRSFRASLGGKDSAGARAEKTEKGKAGAQASMRCMVTGEPTAPAATHPKIMGLSDVGGQGSGSTLIGFDKDSFCSYNLDQSANAAVSEQAAAAYRESLNDLIKKSGKKLAGAKVVYWFDKKVPQDDDPLAFLTDPPEREEKNALALARELTESISAGKRPDLADNRYYGLTLSGAAGRVMVRDWMEGSFESLVKNVASWFDDLSIVARDGEGTARPPKFLAVLGAAVRELDDLDAPYVAKLWRTAVYGHPVPRSALAKSLGRAKMNIMADEPFNHARMGLIKAYHVRKHKMKGGNEMTADVKPYLNEEHPSPAYHCGRLMALYAGLQRAALGDVGAGVVQRYYAAASATPALVLGRLARTSQYHLNKLDTGLAVWFESMIAGVWGSIKDKPPKTLDLEEQSLFALGYYQQLASRKKTASTNADT